MRPLAITACAVALAAAATAGIAAAGIATAAGAPPVTGLDRSDEPEGPDAPDVPLTGQDLDRAVAAALAHTGGGTVTDTEVGDDGAAYGVEIVRPDGRQVELALDAGFTVVGEELDDD